MVLLSKKDICSSLLSLYILSNLAYYLYGNIRMILLPIMLGVSFFSLIITKGLTNKKNLFFYCFIILFFSLLLQVFQLHINVFLIFIPSSFCFAYFIYRNTFNLRILYGAFIITILWLLVLFSSNLTFANIFYDLSVNYVSIILIMYASLISLIAYRQEKKYIITPIFLSFLLSLLAMGRAGILCSFILLLNAIIYKFKHSSIKKPIFSVFILLFIITVIVLYNLEEISSMIEKLSLLERFTEKGVKSPSRGIMIDEYLTNINLETLLLGYNFKENDWFIHYGLNPHNSYIKLHSQLGWLFFVIIYILFISLLKLFKKSIYVFVMLTVMLLRGWTDVFVFLGFYDFIIVYYILHASDDKTIHVITNKSNGF